MLYTCDNCEHVGETDTQRSQTFTLPERAPRIREIDAQGMWLRVFDSEGMEVELTIKGLTMPVIIEWLTANDPASRSAEPAKELGWCDHCAAITTKVHTCKGRRDLILPGKKTE